MEEKYVFMLPSLITDNLCEDDSAHYSFLTFHRQEISNSAKIILEMIDKDSSCVSTASKKRVKVLMEFFAVALSLEIADSKLIDVARDYYAKWLQDSSLFGDNHRQNKYICRIIRQLSLPFAFRSPVSSSMFTNCFLPILLNIISMYDKLCKERGSELEHGTWITLLNTSIGITDAVMNFNRITSLCSNEKITELKRAASTLVFDVIKTSGILEKEDWQRVEKYCQKWSENIDFINVWGENVIDMWKYVNCITYKLPFEKVPITGGVYTKSNPFSDAIAKKVFHNILICIDHTKTLAEPELLLSLAETVKNVKDIALDVAKKSSTGVESMKYSAYAFLKLFGRFVTFAPVLDIKFDQAISINIETITDIIAQFEWNKKAEPTLKRMIAYIVKMTTEKHQIVVNSFIVSSLKLYKHIDTMIPFVSGHVIRLFKSLVLTHCNESTFLDNIVASYCSASASTNEPNNVVYDSFNAVFKSISSMNLRLRLLVNGLAKDIDIHPILCNYFTPDKFKMFAKHYHFASGIISLVGISVRHNPATISRIIDMDIISSIINDVQIPELRGKEGYDSIIMATLQTLCEVAEWAPSIFHIEKNTKAFFEFISFLHDEIKDDKKDEKLWFDKKKKAIQTLMINVVNAVYIHIPSMESITKKLDSSSSLNEEAVVKYLGITDPIINYFTVGNHNLISFIETKDGSFPLAFFVRGQFGKAVFQVSDDYTSGRTEEISDEVHKSELPECKPIGYHKIKLQGDDPVNAPFIPFDELEKVDQMYRDKYGKQFSTWLDWDKDAFYTPFGYKEPYKRLRVVDFLTTFGILDIENKNSVRPQNDLKKVKSVIKRFDEKDSASILPIPIIHFLANDTDLKLTDNKKTRMTPLMLQFLRELGEPLETCERVTELYNIPATNTSIPCIPIFSSLVGFFTPGMGKTAADSQKIADLYGKQPISIVFNESAFDLNVDTNVKPETLLLIVTPIGHSLYDVECINAPNDIPMAFSHQQVMTGKDLGLHITAILEFMLPSLYKTLSAPIAKKRGDIIKDLCGDSKIPELAALSAGMFDKK